MRFQEMSYDGTAGQRTSPHGEYGVITPAVVGAVGSLAAYLMKSKARLRSLKRRLARTQSRKGVGRRIRQARVKSLKRRILRMEKRIHRMSLSVKERRQMRRDSRDDMDGYGAHFPGHRAGHSRWRQPQGRQANLGPVLRQIVTAFQTGGKQEGLRTAARSSRQYGPAVMEAAVLYLSTRKDSAEEITQKIARLRAAQANAFKAGQQQKAVATGYQVAILEMRLAEVRQGRPQAVVDLPDVAGDKERYKQWIPLLSLGLGALGIWMASKNLARRRKKK